MVKNFEQFKRMLELYNGQSQQKKSAWSRGVSLYTYDLLDSIQEDENIITNKKELEQQLLNGADDWFNYSYGGCSLIYDSQICERLCSPSEQKKKDFGRLQPNGKETWLEVQARALYQAANRIKKTWWFLEEV